MAKKTQRISKRKIFLKLADLYQRMEETYQKHAELLGLTCLNCEDNCCKSYFHHHTYLEWAYFWEGLQKLDLEIQENIKQKAKAYVEHLKECLTLGKKPELMCPVNEKGLCILYSHRLMICRLHGVPNFFIAPGGVIREFPGCFKSQKLVQQKKEIKLLDRTPFYQELANLEVDFLGTKRNKLPRVKLTLAEMIVLGPPKI